MEVHPLIDQFALHYDTFAGDVYTLDTASITLTAGTLTAEALVADTTVAAGTNVTAGGAVGATTFVSAGTYVRATTNVIADDHVLAGDHLGWGADLDTFIDNDTANTIQIYTGNVERLEIDSAEATFTVPIATDGAITGTAITGTSFVIGGNTLDTTEWAFLDGQDQAVKIADAPTFAGVTLTGDIIGEQSDEIRNEVAGEWRMKPASGAQMRLRMSGTAPSINIGSNDVFAWVSPDDYIRVIAGGAKHYYIFSTSADGINKEVRVYGFPTGESLKYGQFQMVSGTTTPRFQISTDGEAVQFINDVILSTTSKLHLRDTAIGIYSQADTFMDLFADGGVRIGDSSAGAPTNYSMFEPDGTLVFNGTATVWNDLQFQVSSSRVPASNFPNWEAFTTNTYEYAFDVDEFAYLMSNELHHSWKEGTAANVHLHVTNKTAQNTAPNGDTNQYAKFTVYIAYADTDETWQETSLTAELTIPTGTSALTNFYLDMGDLTLTNYLVGAQIKCTVERIDATGGTEYADSVFITQVGMHLEEDTIGSRVEIEK